MYSSAVWPPAMASDPAGADVPKLLAGVLTLARVTPDSVAASASWPDRDQPDDQQGNPAAGDHHPGQHDRDGDLEDGLVPPLARQHRRQQVVDDLGRRVDDVQQVAERPHAGLDQRHPAARGRLGERVQAARAADVPRVTEPDRQRETERGRRQHHREPGRGDGAAGDQRRVERRQRQRAAERRDRHPGQGPRPERPGRPEGRRQGSPSGRVRSAPPPVIRAGNSVIAVSPNPASGPAAGGLGRRRRGGGSGRRGRGGPRRAAVNELTEAVTSLPAGVTSHHLAPNESLPCPVALPAPESPEK